MGVVEKTMVIEEMGERINDQQNNFRQPSWHAKPRRPTQELWEVFCAPMPSSLPTAKTERH